jgi:hypothetical protein
MSETPPLLDRYFLGVSIERSLFNAYILIFLASAIVTLLGILNIFSIKEEILNLLVKSLIVEVVGGVVALFSSRLITRTSTLKIRLNFETTFDLASITHLKAKCVFIDPDTGHDSEILCNVYKDDYGPCINVTPPNMKRAVSIVLEIEDKTYQGSDWLETRTIELKQI